MYRVWLMRTIRYLCAIIVCTIVIWLAVSLLRMAVMQNLLLLYDGRMRRDYRMRPSCDLPSEERCQEVNVLRSIFLFLQSFVSIHAYYLFVKSFVCIHVFFLCMLIHIYIYICIYIWAFMQILCIHFMRIFFHFMRILIQVFFFHTLTMQPRQCQCVFPYVFVKSYLCILSVVASA